MDPSRKKFKTSENEDHPEDKIRDRELLPTVDKKRILIKRKLESQKENVQFASTMKTIRLPENATQARYAKVTSIRYSEAIIEELQKTGSKSLKLYMETYVYRSDLSGSEALRTITNIKSIQALEELMTRFTKMDVQSLLNFLKNDYISQNQDTVLLYKFIIYFLVFKRWHMFEICLTKIHFPYNSIHVSSIHVQILEETKKARVHIGAVFTKINPHNLNLTKNDMKIVFCALSVHIKKRDLTFMFHYYRGSKYHLNYPKLVGGFVSAISGIRGTYCRRCIKTQTGIQERTLHEMHDLYLYEQCHHNEPIGRLIPLSQNLVLKIMEANHYTRLPISKIFDEYDPEKSGLCGRIEFFEASARALNYMKKRVPLDTSFQDLVFLLYRYNVPGTQLVCWRNFVNEVSCGCEMMNPKSEIDYKPMENIIQAYDPNVSDDEEGLIILCDEYETAPPVNNDQFATKQASHENIQCTSPKAIWNCAPIEAVGNVASSSNMWEEYCNKFASSSEESFSSIKDETTTPLKRTYGSVDIMNNPPIKCLFFHRERYDQEALRNIAIALVQFRECLSNVAGDCIAYARCLDPENTGYIPFEELVEVLIVFGLYIEDEVIDVIQDWFDTERGIDYRCLLDAFYELSETQAAMESRGNDECTCEEVQEEDEGELIEESIEYEEIQVPYPSSSSEAPPTTPTSYEEERESQDASLQNVMSQYQLMTDQALMTIRAAVFEQGISMMDIFRAHDTEETGICTRNELYQIVSPLVNVSEQIWTMIMYKYCRPFEPHIIPYKTFADEIDCNLGEPSDILLPQKYINECCQSNEIRKKIMFIIERIGRTVSLEQIKTIFGDNIERKLTEEEFLKAFDEIKFITISEKELLYKSFTAQIEGTTKFEYERFFRCCRCLQMMFYMGAPMNENQ
ncbi:uncharacterized protein [Halyomorpha halys]|uniref:uncharacterized protein n=1 Tax=Halyomorpha halys TaxID=286706 RepID=UPI0006D519F2|nr:uncharacterized protein LOC106682050 [Halyomorpha halys]